ncbi:MAG: outer membrane protein [Legionellales bacterium]
MLKKTRILLGLFLTAPCFAGLYVGASVGPEGAHFRQKVHVQIPGNFNALDANHFSGIGVFGSIFGGYGWTHNQYYLAGEFNANLSSVEYKLTNDELLHQHLSKTTFKIGNAEGVSLLPGYLLTPVTLAYARIGYANGHLKIVESDPTIHSSSTRRGGIRYGLGIRHGILPHWSVMMDYSQINYRGVKSHVFEPHSGLTKDTRIIPNTAQVGFGLIYAFDKPV